MDPLSFRILMNSVSKSPCVETLLPALICRHMRLIRAYNGVLPADQHLKRELACAIDAYVANDGDAMRKMAGQLNASLPPIGMSARQAKRLGIEPIDISTLGADASPCHGAAARGSSKAKVVERFTAAVREINGTLVAARKEWPGAEFYLSEGHTLNLMSGPHHIGTLADPQRQNVVASGDADGIDAGCR